MHDCMVIIPVSFAVLRFVKQRNVCGKPIKFSSEINSSCYDFACLKCTNGKNFFIFSFC